LLVFEVYCEFLRLNDMLALRVINYLLAYLLTYLIFKTIYVHVSPCLGMFSALFVYFETFKIIIMIMQDCRSSTVSAMVECFCHLSPNVKTTPDNYIRTTFIRRVHY